MTTTYIQTALPTRISKARKQGDLTTPNKCLHSSEEPSSSTIDVSSQLSVNSHSPLAIPQRRNATQHNTAQKKKKKHQTTKTNRKHPIDANVLQFVRAENNSKRKPPRQPPSAFL